MFCLQTSHVSRVTAQVADDWVAAGELLDSAPALVLGAMIGAHNFCFPQEFENMYVDSPLAAGKFAMVAPSPVPRDQH